MHLAPNKTPVTGLDSVTHAFSCGRLPETWMAGSSPAKGMLFTREPG